MINLLKDTQWQKENQQLFIMLLFQYFVYDFVASETDAGVFYEQTRRNSSKIQLWCKYTFAKEQQSSLSNAACPRTVGGPRKVRGNAAELTRRACG